MTQARVLPDGCRCEPGWWDSAPFILPICMNYDPPTWWSICKRCNHGPECHKIRYY